MNFPSLAVFLSPPSLPPKSESVLRAEIEKEINQERLMVARAEVRKMNHQ
jgi:hypothetical protein